MKMPSSQPSPSTTQAAPTGAAAPTSSWDVRIVVGGLPMQSCSVLLSRGPEHIVVDTGFPQHEAILLDGLQRAGVAPDQVTGVINTHFHIDHIGSNALFPRAWIHGSRIDFEWAIAIYESICSGETRRDVFRTFYPEITEADFQRMDQARVLQLIRWMWDPACLGDRGRYTWYEDGPLNLPGIELIPTPGHTPGHLSIAVTGRDDRYLLLGDARAFQDEEALGYDMPPWNRQQYRRSREQFVGFAGIMIPGHDDPFSQSPDNGEPEQAAAGHGHRTGES